MRVTRRQFIRLTGSAVAAGLVPFRSAAPAFAAGTDPVLVVVFLRGAADGLSLVVPHGDARYYAARPTIQVPPGDELNLDGFFGLHPTLSPLLPFYQNNELAIVDAAGSPDPSRSHFDAMDFMEKAAPGDKSVTTGWLNRYLAQISASSPTAGISVAPATILSLAGPQPSLAFASLDTFALQDPYGAERRTMIENMFGAQPPSLVRQAVEDAFVGLDAVAPVVSNPSVTYPGYKVAGALKDAAALIKADIGVRVVAVNEESGWDHHSNTKPRLLLNATGLAESLAAFWTDLGAERQRTVVIVMSEFGRMVAENGAAGSDHGHGNAMYVLGGGVNGGRVLLKDDTWPGLDAGQLFEDRDLAVTTDFRDVFAEVLDRHMGLSDPTALANVFPNFTVSESNYPGLFSA